MKKVKGVEGVRGGVGGVGGVAGLATSVSAGASEGASEGAKRKSPRKRKPRVVLELEDDDGGSGGGGLEEEWDGSASVSEGEEFEMVSSDSDDYDVVRKKKTKTKTKTKTTQKRKRGGGGGGSGGEMDSAKVEAARSVWKEVYEKIEKMREGVVAPVDAMGCERLGDAEANAEVFRYQTLVALMLSSQTKDEITADAIDRLNTGLPGGLNVDSVLEAEPEKLNELIRRVGFHNRKTVYLQKAARILKDKYEGDIPPTIEGLLELPGVGMKMGMLAMQCAWHVNAGIGVDVHVHRISNRLGWVSTKTPEQTRVALESFLPKEVWGPVNPLLVGFGQTICKPVGTKCSECTITHLCPSAFLSSPKKSRKKK